MIKAFIDLNILQKGFEQARWGLEQSLRAPICIPGCGRCCTNKTCMVIEAANMVSHLTGLGKLKAAVDICENWLLEKTVVGAGEIDLSYQGLPTGIVSPQIKEEYHQVERSRCPFLTEDRQCFIYPCRPLLCRAQGVTRIVEGCPRPLGIGENSSRRMVIGSAGFSAAVQDFKAYCERKPEWKIYGFAPTLLFRAAEPDKFRGLVDDNRIPSAKILGTAFDLNLMWQPQIDALQRGESPDNVAYAWTTSDPQAALGKVRGNGKAKSVF